MLSSEIPVQRGQLVGFVSLGMGHFTSFAGWFHSNPAYGAVTLLLPAAFSLEGRDSPSPSGIVLSHSDLQTPPPSTRHRDRQLCPSHHTGLWHTAAGRDEANPRGQEQRLCNLHVQERLVLKFRQRGSSVPALRIPPSHHSITLCSSEYWTSSVTARNMVLKPQKPQVTQISQLDIMVLAA